MVTLIEVAKNYILFLKYTEILNHAVSLRDLFMLDLSVTFSSGEYHGKGKALYIRTVSFKVLQPVPEVMPDAADSRRKSFAGRINVTGCCE